MVEAAVKVEKINSNTFLHRIKIIEKMHVLFRDTGG